MNAIHTQESITLEKLAADHPELFNKVGELKNFEVDLHVDKTVKPVVQPHRRIPFHWRKKIEDELQELLEQDITERVEGPTPWVSPIVTPPKPDKVRLCLDMRQCHASVDVTGRVLKFSLS